MALDASQLFCFALPRDLTLAVSISLERVFIPRGGGND